MASTWAGTGLSVDPSRPSLCPAQYCTLAAPTTSQCWSWRGHPLPLSCSSLTDPFSTGPSAAALQPQNKHRAARHRHRLSLGMQRWQGAGEAQGQAEGLQGPRKAAQVLAWTSRAPALLWGQAASVLRTKGPRIELVLHINTTLIPTVPVLMLTLPPPRGSRHLFIDIAGRGGSC